jgi:hypothetical protein
MHPSAHFSGISHFQNLNTVKDKFKSRIEDLEKKLETLEHSRVFNELDVPITEQKIVHFSGYIPLTRQALKIFL